MAILRLILVVALAFSVAATGVSGKYCYFRDPCSRVRLLSGRPGDFLVNACGQSMIFSPTCVARVISSCKIKDPCPKRAAAAKKNAKRGAKIAKSNAKAGVRKGAKYSPTTALIPNTFRGAVVKDGCNRTFRVSPKCGLIKITARCYKACYVKPIKIGRRTLLRPGRPYTCASRCR